jgi:TM2 domain-containing membrane protein YozV
MKKKSTTIIFWLFSLHRFYLGKIGTGLLYLFSFGGLGIWVIIDIVTILRGKMTDSNGNLLVE